MRYEFPSWLNPELVRELSLRDHWDWYWHKRDDVKSTVPGGVRAVNSFMLPSCLDWHDVMEMSGSFEQRFPYLDLRVLAYCWSLPPIPYRFEKAIVRRAMQNRLPDAVLKRPKQGLPGCMILARGDPIRVTWSECTSRTPRISRYVHTDPLDENDLKTLDSHAVYAIHRAFELASWLFHKNDKP